MREPSLREVAVERIHQNAPVAIASLRRLRMLLDMVHRHEQPSGCTAAEKPHLLSWTKGLALIGDSAVCLTKSRRGFSSAEFDESRVKWSRRSKAAFERDVGDFLVGGDQQTLGMTDSQADDIFPN